MRARPVATGLVSAGALTVSEAAGANALQLVTTAAALGCLVFTTISPYALMIVAASCSARWRSCENLLGRSLRLRAALIRSFLIEPGLEA